MVGSPQLDTSIGPRFQRLGFCLGYLVQHGPEPSALIEARMPAVSAVRSQISRRVVEGNATGGAPICFHPANRGSHHDRLRCDTRRT